MVWEIGPSTLKTGDPVGLDTTGRVNPIIARLKDMNKPFINELHTSVLSIHSKGCDELEETFAPLVFCNADSGVDGDTRMNGIRVVQSLVGIM